MTTEGEVAKRTVLVPRDLFDRFRARHPGHGDFSWFVREALERYVELNEVTPAHLVALAVAEMTMIERREP